MDARIENWDDLRIFLAVAAASTVAEAARSLAVDPTTVTRRVRAFEATLGRKLFDRLRGGVILSPEGLALQVAAADTEASIRALEVEVAGRSNEVSGTVRIAVAELLVMVWTDELVRVAEAFPAINIEVVAGDEMHSLSKREADIAIRVAASPPSHLVGRRYAPIAVAVYGSERIQREHDVRSVPWVGWTGLADDEGVVGFTRAKLGATGQFAIRANSYGLVLDYVRSGAGVTVLPCGLGDADPALRRLTEPDQLSHALWVLTHPDLQRTPRVRVLLDELARIIELTRYRLSPKSDG